MQLLFMYYELVFGGHYPMVSSIDCLDLNNQAPVFNIMF